MVFSVAATSVSKEEAPKAVSKVFIGVSVGMVICVPIASFIASTTSLQMAMVFFAVVNAITFIATLLFAPSMPVKEKLSYRAQVSVLKKFVIWQSIIAVIFLHSAIFGVYSYFAVFLKTVTTMSSNTITIMLVVLVEPILLGMLWQGCRLNLLSCFFSRRPRGSESPSE